MPEKRIENITNSDCNTDTSETEYRHDSGVPNITQQISDQLQPHSPSENNQLDPQNNATTLDLTYNFGSPVLCPSYGAGVSADIGICLGLAYNQKGGILVWIPGHRTPMVRRGIEAMPLTEQLKELLNTMFDGDRTYAKLFHYKKAPAADNAAISENADGEYEEVQVPRPPTTQDQPTTKTRPAVVDRPLPTDGVCHPKISLACNK